MAGKLAANANANATLASQDNQHANMTIQRDKLA